MSTTKSISFATCAMFALISVSVSQVQPNFQVIHAFGATGDVDAPYASVVFDQQGNMYGTAVGGGQYGRGAVYELSPNGSAGWSETILHAFAGPPSDGDEDQGEVLITSAGIYGTTTDGGRYQRGTFYELTPGGSGWNETVLYSFGANMAAGANVVEDSNGDFFTGYGLSELNLGPDGWTDTHICEQGGCLGTNEYSRISMAPHGTIFGASELGGVSLVGTVYEVVPTTDGWQEYDLYDFGASKYDGQIPAYGQLAVDEHDNIYGVTNQGGLHECGDGGCGTIYELMRGSDGKWSETILYNFKHIPSLGTDPISNVIRDKGGNLYGVMGDGGAACGCGTVYRLSPSQSGEWNYTVLHTFVGTDGILPWASLTFGPDGNLYGTTVGGGPNGGGVVFEISRE